MLRPDPYDLDDTHDLDNDGNELLSNRHYRYQYDNNGNMIAKLALDDDDEESFAYRYDYENRLIKVVKTEEDKTTIVTFKYDPFGRRIEKKVVKSDKDGDEDETKSKVYRYFYDNEDILSETIVKEDDGKTKEETRQYVHGPGIDEPLALVERRHTWYYHADGQGSIVAMTDKRGKVVQDYEYDSFGNLHDQKGRIKQPYTYTGREYDRETGLYYYRARYYDTEVGRFISKDPIAIWGNIYNQKYNVTFLQYVGAVSNSFAYTENNPLNWIDPWGLWSIGGGGVMGPLVFSVDSSNPTKTKVSVISDLEIGGGITICFDHPIEDCDPPEDVPFFPINIGMGKFTGVTFYPDKWCINLGISRGFLPVDVTLFDNE